ncbi:uncharacterized protein METZ01_LOCUS159768 [marine metagenome]|uniref:Uncharacterized protein n=1 Tax=marine metagenome TaxID=408172 RepID=A0A382AZX9_9ZZZZ
MQLGSKSDNKPSNNLREGGEAEPEL